MKAWAKEKWLKYRRWDDGEDRRVCRVWHTAAAIVWLSVCGPLLLVAAAETADGDTLAEPATLFVVVGLLGTFVGVRRLVAVWGASVTRDQARERDLWRGDRLLLVGAVILFAPALIIVFVMDLNADFSGAMIAVVTALMIIGPVSEWVRNGGVWDLLKERIDQKVGR